MAGSENPLHKGNQAFVDEDYPTTLQVRGLCSLLYCWVLTRSILTAVQSMSINELARSFRIRC